MAPCGRTLASAAVCCSGRRGGSPLQTPSAADCCRAAATGAACVCVALCLLYGALSPSPAGQPPAPSAEARGPASSGGNHLPRPRAAAAPVARRSSTSPLPPKTTRSQRANRSLLAASSLPTELVRCLDERGAPLSDALVPSGDDCPAPSPANGSQPPLHLRRFIEYSFVGCLSQPPPRDSSMRTRLRSMTVSRCLTACYDAGFNYAFLARGDTCTCHASAAGAADIAERGDCLQPCSGNATEACGGARSASVYHLRSPDGGHDWSVWMSPPWHEFGSVYATRIRDCLLLGGGGSSGDGGGGDDAAGDAAASRECNATVDKRWDHSTPAPPAFEHFIGCFAFGSWPSGAAIMVPNASRSDDPHGCVSRCSRARAVGGGARDGASEEGYDYALYAAAAAAAGRRCVCSRSLGVARPFRHCDYAGSRAVYAAGSAVADGGQVRLRFAPRPRTRKVHLLAYFRSGSTFASEILGHHPGALYLYEPDAAYGLSWDDDDWRRKYGAHGEFYRALARYTDCDVYRLPPKWMTLNARWPRDLELTPRYAEYCACLRAYGAEPCAAVFQAHCDAATVVAAKTIRVGSAMHAEHFARRHGDVVVLHLMRDPRGILSSRKHLRVGVTASRVRRLCGRLVALRDVVSRLSALGYATHNLRYEDVVESPIDTAQLVLERYLGLEVSVALAERLLVITGHLGGADDDDDDSAAAAAPGEEAKQGGGPAASAFDTRRQNSRSSLHKWRRTLSAAELRLVSEHCAELLD